MMCYYLNVQFQGQRVNLLLGLPSGHVPWYLPSIMLHEYLRLFIFLYTLALVPSNAQSLDLRSYMFRPPVVAITQVKHQNVRCVNVLILQDVWRQRFLRVTCYMFQPMRNLENYKIQNRKTDECQWPTNIFHVCYFWFFLPVRDWFWCSFIVDANLVLQICNNTAEVVRNRTLRSDYSYMDIYSNHACILRNISLILG